jgi:hypothetical protein
MTPLEVYKKFLLRINKNDTNVNVSIPKGEFILLFNEEVQKWLSNKIQVNQTTSLIEDIEELLEVDFELEKLEDKRLFTEFKRPSNFFASVSAYCLATKGSCIDNVLITHNFKPKNLNYLITNENEKPSFEYQETLITFSSGKVLIYKTDFDVNTCFLTYYRLPIKLDIEGYINIDGNTSTNVQTDLQDTNIEEVLDMCAKTILGRYEHIEGYQIAQKQVIDNK